MLSCPPSSLPYIIEIFIVRRMVDLYYTAVGLEKCDREQTDREQRTEKSIKEATLIRMDRQVERANIFFNVVR